MASLDPDCMGFAPEAELYSFRVFNVKSKAYTSWFLDALNQAMHSGIHIINLSVGGPDWEDTPFVDKVREVSGTGVIIVSAIGTVCHRRTAGRQPP
jgi:membrane-bound transcription factor site-1 protease